MNIPNDAFHGANGVHIKIEKQESGGYVATCQSIPELPATKAADAATATELQKRQIEKHLRRG